MNKEIYKNIKKLDDIREDDLYPGSQFKYAGKIHTIVSSFRYREREFWIVEKYVNDKPEGFIYAYDSDMFCYITKLD